ncbi:GspH/FimT family pseudopilin [Pseudomonas argentinensis]|uniref:GspH/FimT family pseudopilin n=1 Tax=Phytopseudomonas argentinensis TaxID=289370 RepID=UPI0008A83565|nr:GspH/FimT family pseudopilin [Pseudomonas argentinensis]
MPKYRHQLGFTLIELMVVVALLGIFAAIALPSFSSLIKNNRVQGDSAELQSLLAYARSEAVTRRTIVTFSNTQGVWAASITSGNTTTTLRSFTANTVNVSANPTSVAFRPDGTASAAAKFTLCSGTDFANGYEVAVAITGSSRLSQRGKTAANNTVALTSCTS